jgi:unsaturated chondroitin disaccharide hydrolase
VLKVDYTITAKSLVPKIDQLFDLSAGKISSLLKTWDERDGAPVFTVRGRYTSRAWTEWTLGFMYGSALLQFDATGEKKFLELGRKGTLRRMGKYVTHMGVHDHGFNIVSTYGNLHRFMRESRIPFNEWEKHCYGMALECSGAVQAARWTKTIDGKGFIYSFNGPHSLFADTIRTLRSLAIAHQLGHVLMGEHDEPISLIERLILHAETTAKYSVYYGEGRDAYDVRGRVAHESLFNPKNGVYRCPSTQQGYSPFTTWARGLGWVMLGFAEQLEFIETLSQKELEHFGGKKKILTTMEKAARATCDYYIENTPTDGIPYWDTGAPGLNKIGDYLDQAADPFNDFEPVDSSAATIAAQGLLRLGRFLMEKGSKKDGKRYIQAGLTIAGTLFSPPYLSTRASHQGLILHSVYHRPKGWDYIPSGSKIPNGESSMWGDYHARELGLMILREAKRMPYLTFFDPE